MSTSYQRRVKELKAANDKIWQLETSKKSIAYDNEMMQVEYDKMKKEYENYEKLHKFAGKVTKVSITLGLALLYAIAFIIYLIYA